MHLIEATHITALLNQFIFQHQKSYLAFFMFIYYCLSKEKSKKAQKFLFANMFDLIAMLLVHFYILGTWGQNADASLKYTFN